MDIRIIENRITKNELKELAKEFYVEMVKGVVDLEKEIIALGGEWHMDANQKLIDNGSLQKDLWGFNIYVDKDKNERVEYTSLINIRPNQENNSMEIKNEKVRIKIFDIINKLVE